MAKGRRRMPDSPESAGFFDATKNTQARTPAADNRNNPAASAPPREYLSAGFIPDSFPIKRHKLDSRVSNNSHSRIKLAHQGPPRDPRKEAQR